ncbi:hypothetical protein ACHAXT_007099 [Thalassiosira profunda]
MNSHAPKKPRLSLGAPVLLVDLPDSLLAEVGTYLTPTTLALWAVAMTASPASWFSSGWQSPPSLASRAIMGQDEISDAAKIWEELNFEDVPKSLRVKLSDIDLGGMLVCMDAKHTLKSLKLTHCFGIFGAGLGPLRGSKVLRQIDLSLVGLHESPAIDAGDLALDEGTVICILDSIIGQSGSSLMHVQLPKRWREPQSRKMSNFLERFGEYLGSRQLACVAKTHRHSTTMCGELVQGTEEHPCILSFANMSGVQGQTCYKCLNSFCHDCGYMSCWVNPCHGCEKMFCDDCVVTSHCDVGACVGGDQKMSCDKCNLVMTCSGCESQFCSDCGQMEECTFCGCDTCEFCSSECESESCNAVSCFRCSEENIKAVRYCSDCEVRVCVECRVQTCKQERDGGRSSCAVCMRIILPWLLFDVETGDNFFS